MDKNVNPPTVIGDDLVDGERGGLQAKEAAQAEVQRRPARGPGRTGRGGGV